MNILQIIKNWFLSRPKAPSEVTVLTPYRFGAYGINDYPDNNDLNGCINDAIDWKSYAQSSIGFAADACKVITDKECTKNGILDLWKWALDGVQPGHLVFLTGSSHGAQVPDKTGDEADRIDEVICTYDFNWSSTYISDDDVAKIFSGIPKGALVVMVLDSCHSGTMNRAVTFKDYKPRCIKMPPDLLQKAQRIKPKMIRRMGTAAAQPGEPENFIILSGCRSDEFSYDAVFNNRPNGAFSFTALNVLKSFGKGPKVSYDELVRQINHNITEPQHPQLCCLPDVKMLNVFTQGLK